MKAGAGLAIVLLIIALFVLGPIVVIWAMNALFPVLAIPTTLKTWFATIVICGVLRAQASGSKS